MERLPAVKLLSREGLSSIRGRALRRGVWFRALTRLERAIVDLTIRCVDRVRSPVLAGVIGKIVCKVLKALRSRFLVRAERVGFELAERVCRVAVEWGYVGASSWRRDINFVRFLGVNAISSVRKVS